MIQKDLIKNINPIIYQTIKNAFDNNSLSHAYLFSYKNQLHNDNEIKFLIQLIISKNNVNENIKRYVDYYEICTNDSLIKKDQITSTISKLSEKSFKKNSPKILYIKKIENATKQSLNSLLKFLEEPTNDTYIIFSTNNISSVLNTIKSRCQIINVRNKNRIENIKLLNENGMNLELAKIFANISNNFENLKKYKEDEILEIKEYILNTLLISINNMNIYVNFINKINKNNYMIYFGILQIFFNDIWKYSTGIETTFEMNELYEKYLSINFDYHSALLIIGEFIRLQKKVINFELFKNYCLINLERLYG